MIKMIMCVDAQNGIGKDNKIPWNIPNELHHFINETKNQIVVMGSNTFFSIGKILESRTNIIFSRSIKNIEGAQVCSKISQILKLSKTKDVYIIGGKMIFELFEPYADELIISKLKHSYNCDIFYNPDVKFYKETKISEYKDFNVHYYTNIKHKLLDGNKVKNFILNELTYKFNELKSTLNKVQLAIINIGNNYASNKYIKNKILLGQQLGVDIKLIEFPENVLENKVIDTINELNNDLNVYGIIVQLPLPIHLSKINILNSISPNKDIDCLNEINLGKNLNFDPNNDLFPCTVEAIMDIINFYKIKIERKNVVVVGRSDIVSKPVALQMLKNNATVTICHSYTKNINSYLKNADLIITAAGQPGLINAKNIKRNSIIFDVSINYIDNKIVGDVKFNDVIDKVKYITPVPGGIGAVTVCEVYKNLLKIINKNRLFCTK